MTTHLVAGAAGFLGSHLTDSLLATGDTVVGIDDLSTGTSANLDAARATGRFSFHERDISIPAPDEGRLERIWNLASPASPPDYLRMPVETLRAGSIGTLNLLELARRHDARFFLTSTSEVYGDPTVSPQPEEYWGNVNSIGPRSVYDEAKRFAEAAVMAYQRTYGLQTRIARVFNTYGPRMRPHDGRVITNFISQALDNAPLTIYGDGRQTRSFCYVDDEIEGLRLLMESSYALPMNIGNPRELTMLELAGLLEKTLGRALPLRHEPLPTDDPRQRRPDITKARNILGWEPRVTLEEGLARTVAWFRSAERA